MRPVGKALNGVLARAGLRLVRSHSSDSWSHPSAPELHHSKVTPRATYSPWLGDGEFAETLNEVLSHTLVDPYRLYELWSLARQARNVPGDILEVGVWRGGSAAILAKAVMGMNKRVWLADTFEGVVKAGSLDTAYHGGEHADAKPADVEDLMARSKVKDYEILIGTFPDDTGTRIRNALALVHVDVDVYESARAVVEFVQPLLSVGGLIIFDDYGFYGCEGVTRFVNELYDRREWIVVHNLNGHAVAVKLVSE